MFAPGTHAWTRSGARVDIVAVLPTPDVNGDSIIGLLHDDHGAEIATWQGNGLFRSKHISGLDLVEAA